ncbi:MAG TPA: tail fiber domain-containing protein [Longimicrobiaceae bacterium]|nr:tail fiber domain-containing protein [Longimicrobiaceae bacterium]
MNGDSSHNALDCQGEDGEDGAPGADGEDGVVATNAAGAYDLSNVNGFVAEGTPFSGNIPESGAGTRLMWYPNKAAFRAGEITGTQWDDANIGLYSTAFGFNARASGDYAFAAGRGSTAANTSSVALGEDVTATGAASVALGYHAHTNARQGSFVFADRSSVDSVRAGATHQATWRTSGGFRIYTNSTLTAGAELSAGGSSWSVVSDRNRKENFLAVDGEDLLRRLRAVPVTTWNYIAEGRQVRHIGPMAQDWDQAFGFSGDPLTINTGDFDGVNLAAAQALDRRTSEQQARIEALERENAALKARLDRMEALVAGRAKPVKP